MLISTQMDDFALYGLSLLNLICKQMFVLPLHRRAL